MKNIVVLEINDKKNCLGTIELEVPSEMLFFNHTESITNNRVINEFIDEIYTFIVDELVYQVGDNKIDNVYVTFLNNNNEFICSIVLDKFKFNKGTYRMSVVDWESTEYTYKYLDEEQ